MKRLEKEKINIYTNKFKRRRRRKLGRVLQRKNKYRLMRHVVTSLKKWTFRISLLASTSHSLEAIFLSNNWESIHTHYPREVLYLDQKPQISTLKGSRLSKGKNRLKISLQLKLVTTQEVSVFEKTYKALEFISSTNVSTTIASQYNIKKFLQDIERGKRKIGTLENLLLQDIIERVHLSHQHDSLEVKKRNVEFLDQNLESERMRQSPRLKLSILKRKS